MNQVMTRPDSESTRRSEAALIDCDVHPLFHTLADLEPYMSKKFLRSCNLFGHVGGVPREPNRILHPTGPLRLDAVTPEGGHPGSDPQFAREQWLDRYALDAAILVPIQAAAVLAWADLDLGSTYLRALNDFFLDNWVAADDRFKLAISVNPHDPASAVAELERHADTPGVVAINVPQAAIGLGAEHFFPLYEAAADRGLPIVNHPTGAEGNIGTSPTFAGGLVRTYPEHHSMLAQAGQAALASLVLGGAFERFPRLKYVFAEFGFAWAPALMWRMDDIGMREPLELRGLSRAPSDYVRSNVRFTTQPIDEPERREELWQTMDMMAAARTLMFSSDYPHWDADEPRTVLRSSIPPKLRRAVAFDTARDCFGERLGL